MKVFYILSAMIAVTIAATSFWFVKNEASQAIAVYTPTAQETVIDGKEPIMAPEEVVIDEVEQTEEPQEQPAKVEKIDLNSILDDAAKQYSDNNIAKAIDALEGASKILREYQSAELESLLPKTIEGWQIRSENDIEEKQAKPSVGISKASREFVNDDKLVEVSILIDSPKVDEMFNQASQDGGSGVGDYKGYIKTFTRTPTKNTLSIAVGKNGLVEIAGFAISHSLANDLAGSIDLAAILEYANN